MQEAVGTRRLGEARGLYLGPAARQRWGRRRVAGGSDGLEKAGPAEWGGCAGQSIDGWLDPACDLSDSLGGLSGGLLDPLCELRCLLEIWRHSCLHPRRGLADLARLGGSRVNDARHGPL